MNHAELLARGTKAKALLQDPLLIEAFSNVEKAIHDAWATAPIRDVEGQMHLRLMLKLLGDVKADLEQAVTDGTMAAAELKAMQSRKPVPLNEWRQTYR